jgi:ketosteroid isomerase-like protein
MPATVARRLCAAMNAHDLDAFADCFTEDYSSEQPAHPARSFRGRDQARQNWSAMFAGMPDFRADLVRSAAADGIEWSEWRWHGTHEDGTTLDMAGVFVAGVSDARIAWARLYFEPVEAEGEGIAAVVRTLAGD